jgi:hypothetical protein
MKNIKNKTKCASINEKLTKAISARVNINSGWLSDHIATCPRCQKRLGNIARVNLAFSLIRSQTHTIDLFKNANTQAVNTLKHSLRYSPDAEKLRQFQPKPNIFIRKARLISSMGNVAACIAVLFLLKIGIFQSLDSFQQKGKESVKQYYAKYLDE